MISNVDVNQCSSTDTEPAFQQNMIRWGEAIHCFYHLNIELGRVISTGKHKGGSGADATIFVGQCSMDQLMSLQVTMNRKLVYLLNDLDLPDNSAGMKTLQSHMTLLNMWSKQVKEALYLAALPAC